LYRSHRQPGPPALDLCAPGLRIFIFPHLLRSLPLFAHLLTSRLYIVGEEEIRRKTA
jgi:hypothetical protein